MDRDVLCHHGVKGMKWGVRRYQNKDGSLTPLGKEHATSLDSNSIEKVSNKTNLKIAKGTTMYRISTSQKDKKDTRYMSYRDNDRNFYKGYWKHILDESKPNAKIYEQTYTTTKDIFIPSAKTRRKMLSDLLDDEEVIKSIYGDNYSETASKQFHSVSKKWSKSKRANYVSGFMGTNPDILSKYGKQIISKGFNATVDDGGRTVGEMPLILFKSNSSTMQKGYEAINRVMQDSAKMTYNEKAAKKYRSKTARI